MTASSTVAGVLLNGVYGKPPKHFEDWPRDDGHESVEVAQRVAAMVISGDYSDAEIEALLAGHIHDA